MKLPIVAPEVNKTTELTYYIFRQVNFYFQFGGEEGVGIIFILYISQTNIDKMQMSHDYLK